MSEQRKRRTTFTDADIASMYSGAGWGEQLQDDHLQAREDVKRLVAMFREIQKSGGIPGWAAHDVHALLSEVAPLPEGR